jgi:hypothetical protein
MRWRGCEGSAKKRRMFVRSFGAPMPTNTSCYIQPIVVNGFLRHNPLWSTQSRWILAFSGLERFSCVYLTITLADHKHDRKPG